MVVAHARICKLLSDYAGPYSAVGDEVMQTSCVRLRIKSLEEIFIVLMIVLILRLACFGRELDNTWSMVNTWPSFLASLVGAR